MSTKSTAFVESNQVHGIRFSPIWFGILIYQIIIYFLFLSNRDWGVGITLFEVAHLVPFLLLSKNRSPFTLAKAGLAIGLSTIWWLRDYSTLQSFSLLAVFVLNISVIYETTTGHLTPFSYFLWQPRYWWSKLVFYTGHFIRTLLSWRTYLSFSGKQVPKIEFGRIFVGALLAIPVLFILSMLFASSDQNFEQLLETIFRNLDHFFFKLTWLQNLGWLKTWLLELASIWAYLMMVLPPPAQEQPLKTKPWQEKVVEKVTAAVLVGGVFAAFIATQVKSIEAIIKGFQSGQLNPSLFVREGFGQLIIACAIGLGMYSLVKRELPWAATPRRHQIVFGVSLVLLLEIWLVSLVAGERVWLYQWEFGLTRIRFWGMALLVVLNVMLLTLFSELFKKISQTLTLQVFILTAAIAIGGAAFLNVDRFVSTWRPARINGETDWSYLLSLSFDATPAWLNRLENVTPQLTAKLAECAQTNDEAQLSACSYLVDDHRDEMVFISNLFNRLQKDQRADLDTDSWAQHTYLNTLATSSPPAFCDDKRPALTSWHVSRWWHQQQLCQKSDVWTEFQTQYLAARTKIAKTHTPLTIKVLSIEFVPDTVTPRYKPSELATDLVNVMADASRYQGQGDSALNYRIVNTQRVNRSTTKDTSNLMNYPALFEEFDICNRVAQDEVDEVWTWVNGADGQGLLYAITGPELLVDSGRNLPTCGSNYVTVMSFDYTRSYDLALMSMAFRMTWIAQHLSEKQPNDLVLPPDAASSDWRWNCGLASRALNAEDVFDYDNQTPTPNTCSTWQGHNASAQAATIDCRDWNCNQAGYLRWWFQRIPGIDNELKDSSGKPLPNWFYAFGDYEGYRKLTSS